MQWKHSYTLWQIYFFKDANVYFIDFETNVKRWPTVNEPGLFHVDKGNQRFREIGMLASICPLTQTSAYWEGPEDCLWGILQKTDLWTSMTEKICHCCSLYATLHSGGQRSQLDKSNTTSLLVSRSNKGHVAALNPQRQDVVNRDKVMVTVERCV